MCRLIFQIVLSVLLCFQAFGNKSDSSRYYFKLSGNVGYGLETFKYMGSHGYQSSYRSNNYSYGGTIKADHIIAQKYGAEIKLDCELPLGIKIVNGISYNAFTFSTPEYAGDLRHDYISNVNPIYTYKIKEKINVETIHGFFGLGYGRKIKKIIYDADVCLDLYKVKQLFSEKNIIYDGNTGTYPKPSTSSAYTKDDLSGFGPGMAIKGSVNVAYRIAPSLYVRAGLVYRYDLYGLYAESYVNNESLSSEFTNIKTYMLNLGFSVSVK